MFSITGLFFNTVFIYIPNKSIKSFKHPCLDKDVLFGVNGSQYSHTCPGMQCTRSGQVRPTGIKPLSGVILTISKGKQKHELMLNLKGFSI